MSLSPHLTDRNGLIAKLQDLFAIGTLNPISLRAIEAVPYGEKGEVVNLNFFARDYPEPLARWNAFLDKARELNERRFNIYTLLNPINPEFDGYAVADQDIQCRRLLLIDLDRSEKLSPPKPATDDDITNALRVAERVSGWMREQGADDPIRVMSGNGIHLYFRLPDLPNDMRSRNVCAKLLRKLKLQFGTNEITVDTAVSNAGRVTKVPGTVAWKGEASGDRPHRRAEFI